MATPHGYTIRGISRTKTVMFVCILSNFIYIFLKFIIGMFINITSLVEGYILVPITFSCVFGLLFMIYNNYMWKIRFLNKIWNVPNISGRWKCEGNTYKKSPSESQRTGCRGIERQYSWEGSVTIIQKWNSILISLSTDKSNSESFMAQIEVIDDKSCQLLYAYKNVTIPGAFVDMRGHEGICRITFSESLTFGAGEYFTNPKDRLSYGTMKWIRV